MTVLLNEQKLIESLQQYLTELDLKRFFHVIYTFTVTFPILEVYVIVSYNKDGSFTLEVSLNNGVVF